MNDRSTNLRAVDVDLDGFDGVVVDLDGVVTDTASTHAAAWAELFDGLLATMMSGQPAFDPAIEYPRLVDGKARADGVASFLAARGIDLPVGAIDDPPDARSIHGLANRKDLLFQARLHRDGVAAFPSTLAFLEGLHADARPVAVVSASRNCRDVLAAAHLEDVFDVVVDGVRAAERSLPGKPDPATFLLAADELGVAPRRAILVEDSLAGVEAARRGGFGLVIGIDRHGMADELRTAGADLVVGDLGELSFVDRLWSVSHDEGLGNADGPHDALFALGDGAIGVRGDIEGGDPTRPWLTLVSGTYGASRDGAVRLLPGPSLGPLLAGARTLPGPARRTLHLRSGTVTRSPLGSAPGLWSSRFVSTTRPGLVVVRASGPPATVWAEPLLVTPELGSSASLGADLSFVSGAEGGERWAATVGDRAQVTAVGRDRERHDARAAWLERLVVVGDAKDRTEARHALAAAEAVGIPAVAREHRREWEARWDGADIRIEGDDTSQQAVRFALLHLLSCAPDSGEAAVGARGLTGLAYSGHVFWDAEVFVLPVLAAVRPTAAKAMLAYRLHRLEPARSEARRRGHAGARFPWESADTGDDVTPDKAFDQDGKVVAILTGRYEEHVNAGVAWAAHHYGEWTGDRAMRTGAGRDLMVETARYWASRIRVDADGLGHLDQVMGPDEYHEVVDDNCFTNVMARWHLRLAAPLLATRAPDEAARWQALADALVDGYDAESSRHEQFTGFWDLEPLRITDVADVPVAADVLLGPDRVVRAQVIKQPDVLMAHHLIPDDLPAGSLAADLDFYLPRTAHGSSLSPGICASLLARSGRADDAMALYDVCARLDLDDLTGITGGGLHLAALGGLWQATVHGFGGVRPAGGALHVDPHLPSRWDRLSLRLSFRGAAVHLGIGHDDITVEADGPVPVIACGVRLTGAGRAVRDGSSWRQAT